MRANQDIRDEVAKNGFKLWELADAMGLYDGNLSRKLRKELSGTQKAAILNIIADMKDRRDRKEGTTCD